ncbi:uncharacterized protein LOC108845897 [Raphanus sativus]|uniref:Uncharacterized protein LOC108845897 n=1 Tax=Raphanus sativus TaxID=3726 RepID=A0A6J0MRS3_RAPSA|nr:uncharacterized protein LOC108845897 [Raphanus sativus]
MPPKRAAPVVGTAQRVARRATRSAFQASSEAESQNGGAPANGNPAGGPNVVNAAILEELRRYREAYGGQLPNGEAAAGAGAVPIPPAVDQNPLLPPPPPPAAPAVVPAQGPTYWDMMRHMRNMQMEFFSGKADAILADNWRRQLERNFESARCPPEFRRDLAVHHLKDDALVWWEGVVESSHGIRMTYDDFLEEFNGKYFPLEAMDQMESKFQDIRQGSRNVREYGDEFHKLRRFAGHYLNDRELVRRFLKGMRIELRNSCNVRDYRNVHELIEKAAEQEAGLEEERKQHQAAPDTSREIVRIKDRDVRERVLECDVTVVGKKDMSSETAGHSWEETREGCSHNSRESRLGDPELTRLKAVKGLNRSRTFTGSYNTKVAGVETAGKERITTNWKYEEVSVVLAGINLPANLLELELGRYEVILGMDWLAQHGAIVDCAKTCVRIPLDGRQIVYRGMKTRTGVSVISMVQAEEAIRRGSEAFLATIEMVEETEAPDLGNISVAAEYADVFEPLRGPPPHRSNAFTIELEPGTAPVSKAPYRLAPAEMAELKKQLEELVEKGWEPTTLHRLPRIEQGDRQEQVSPSPHR